MFESMTPWLIAAAIGGGCAVFAIKNGMLPLSKSARTSVEDLVKNQIVDDEFDGRSLLTWAKRNRPQGEFKIVLVKPTATWIKRLGLTDAQNIDAEKNLIGCMMDAKSNKVLDMQLFTFSSMSKKMRDNFKDSDEFVVTS